MNGNASDIDSRLHGLRIPVVVDSRGIHYLSTRLVLDLLSLRIAKVKYPNFSEDCQRVGHADTVAFNDIAVASEYDTEQYSRVKPWYSVAEDIRFFSHHRGFPDIDWKLYYGAIMKICESPGTVFMKLVRDKYFTPEGKLVALRHRKLGNIIVCHWHQHHKKFQIRFPEILTHLEYNVPVSDLKLLLLRERFTSSDVVCHVSSRNPHVIMTPIISLWNPNNDDDEYDDDDEEEEEEEEEEEVEEVEVEVEEEEEEEEEEAIIARMIKSTQTLLSKNRKRKQREQREEANEIVLLREEVRVLKAKHAATISTLDILMSGLQAAKVAIE